MFHLNAFCERPCWNQNRLAWCLQYYKDCIYQQVEIFKIPSILPLQKVIWKALTTFLLQRIDYCSLILELLLSCKIFLTPKIKLLPDWAVLGWWSESGNFTQNLLHILGVLINAKQWCMFLQKRVANRRDVFICP